jgi:orotate phosphoribosyltransferase
MVGHSKEAGEKPVVVAAALSQLTPAELDIALHDAQVYDRQTGWSRTAQKFGIHFELSCVEWVELEAVVSVLLLLERAKVDGLSTFVTLPVPYVMNRMPDGSADSPARAQRRAAVVRYLEYLRFREAASVGHVAGPVLQYLDQPTSPRRQVAADASETRVRPKLYRYVFPLIWLSSGDDEQISSMVNFIRLVVGDPERGVQSLDAMAIANVLLYELIENVRSHSGASGHALVAARTRLAADSPRAADYYATDRAYVEWLRGAERPVVELVIGDSGLGTDCTLQGAYEAARDTKSITPVRDWSDAANILAWSLDRWSSREATDGKRGTRGLYRVNRVVTKYQGLVSVRSGATAVVADHGGANYDSIDRVDGLAATPGTTVRLWVPAFRTYIPERQSAQPRYRASYRFAGLGHLSSDGLTAESRSRLLDALRSGRKTARCLVAVVEGGVHDRRALESFLRDVTEVRHPAALLVFGLPGGWELVSGAVESVNLDHERRRRSDEHASSTHFEIWDPVLVVGSSASEYAWVGATETVRLVLDALLQQSRLTATDLASLLPDERVRGEALRNLRNDPALVAIAEDGAMTLRVSLKALADDIQQKVSRHITTHREGVRKGPFITPSLNTVNGWIDVPTVLARISTPFVGLFVLTERVRAEFQRDLSVTAVLADASVPAAHVEIVRTLINASRKEVIPGETGLREAEGARVLEPGANVLVYADVIASGESAGRCIAQALRDGANVVAVACVVDARAVPSPFVAYAGVQFPLVSVTAAEFVTEREGEHAAEFIDPVTHRPEQQVLAPEPLNYELSEPEFAELLRKTGALHFRHVGNRALSRHFTLYLDPSVLLRDEVVVSRIDSTIRTWLQGHTATSESSNAVILTVATDRETGSPLPELVRNLQQKFQNITARVVERRPAFGRWIFALQDASRLESSRAVVIDWGALSGHTITRLVEVAATHGAREILALVFVSQLSEDEERFLRSISEVRPPVMTSKSQLSLPLTGESRVQTSDISRRGRIHSRTRSTVSFKFLAHFSIEAYGPTTNCPSCKQLDRMAGEEYPTSLLRDYAAALKTQRLRRWKREELQSGVADAGGAPRVTAAVAGAMAEFRAKLQHALSSTRSRADVRDMFAEMATALERGGPISDAACAVIHFLAVEYQWLSRPPLHFAELRDLIARLSAAVVRHPDADTDIMVSAIVVYRIGNKALFAVKYAELFAAVAANAEALKQMLYSAFTYIARPYAQVVERLRPMLASLQEIEVNSYSWPVRLPADVGATLTALSARAEFEYARAEQRATPSREAWRQLRAAIDVEQAKHHPVTVAAMSRMMPGSDVAAIEAAVERVERGAEHALPPDLLDWIRHLDEYWTPCRRFLDRTLLPLLARMSDIVHSDDFRATVGPEVGSRLREIIQSKSPVAESKFGLLLRDAAQRPDTIITRRNWRLYINELAWYYNGVFKTQDETGGPAAIVEFVRTIPSSVVGAIRSIVAAADVPTEVRVEGLDELPVDDAGVFCPDFLLRDVLQHLLSNAWRHRRLGKVPGIRFAVDIEAECVTLSARTWHTEARVADTSGGITELNRRLAPFDARIVMNTRPMKSRFTFESQLVLWRV